MKFINQITIAGSINFVGKSIATKNGAMCSFILGFSNGKDKDTNKTKYGSIECTTFDKDVVDNVTNLGKGAKVLVTGRLAEDSWSKNGNETKKLKLIVENVCQ